MADALNTYRSILELLGQPALLTEKNKILFANLAAENLGFCAGDAAPDCPEGHTVATYGAKAWELTRRKGEDGMEIILFYAPENADKTDALQAVSRSLSPALTALFSAAGKLFPALEEMEDEDLQQSTAIMTKSFFELLRAANAMNLYANLTTGTSPAPLEKIDLVQLFTETAEKAADLLADCKRKLSYTCPQGSIWTLGDARQLEQAFLRLLTNAAAACSEGDTITATLTKSGASAVLTVKDTGKGMAPGVFATAFSRYQGAAERFGTDSGAGLGLSIVQAIAARHGGNVLLNSQEGEGTTATLTIALKQADGDELRTPEVKYLHGYDPALIEFSPLLPFRTFDSRNIDL